jgi:hypothetical protein
LLATANDPPNVVAPILVTLMMEVLSSSETSVLTEPHGVTSQKTPSFNDNHEFGTDLVMYKVIITSTVKMVESVSDGMTYTIIRVTV